MHILYVVDYDHDVGYRDADDADGDADDNDKHGDHGCDGDDDNRDQGDACDDDGDGWARDNENETPSEAGRVRRDTQTIGLSGFMVP